MSNSVSKRKREVGRKMEEDAGRGGERPEQAKESGEGEEGDSQGRREA